MNEALYTALIQDEGLRLKPYRCTAGKLTIGVGRNLDDTGLSRAEALYLLQQDLQRVAQGLTRRWPQWQQLNRVRQNVLLNMAFNLGLQAFSRFQKFWAAIDAHDYDQAAAEMLASRWSRQVGQRAQRLARQMQTGKP